MVELLIRLTRRAHALIPALKSALELIANTDTELGISDSELPPLSGWLSTSSDAGIDSGANSQNRPGTLTPELELAEIRIRSFRKDQQFGNNKKKESPANLKAFLFILARAASNFSHAVNYLLSPK